MHSDEARRSPPALSTLPVDALAGAGEAAAFVVTTLRRFVAALVPIIGTAGMAALYRRSLHLAGRNYPWIAGALEAPEDPQLRLAALQAALEGHGDDACAGGEHLLQVFRDLLTSLIGAALTGQLLDQAEPQPATEPRDQDRPS